MILLIDKFIKKFKRGWTKSVFKRIVNCKHNSFKLVGDVIAINPNVTIGKNVVILPDVMFHGDGPIVLGDNVTIGNGTIIYSSKQGGVYIGNNSMIAAQCYIIDMDHGVRKDILIRDQENTVAPIVIGNDCWIAADVTVLKGSKINDGAIVGAKALVNGEIPENAIAVGIPAKVINYRS